MKKFFKVIGIIVVSFIAIGAIGAIFSGDKPTTAPTTERVSTPAPTPVVEYPVVSATDIINAYKNNELQADRDLKDKRGIIKGKVADISRMFGQVSVTLYGDDEWSITNISCNFSDVEAEKLISVNAGDIVNIEGTIDGLGWSIDVSDCILR